MSKQLKVSNQWIITYYKAISQAWENQDFKNELLNNASSALKKLGFNVPQNISVVFEEVTNNDFSNFPEFSPIIFDELHKSNVVVKLPIPQAPTKLEESLHHLHSISNIPTSVGCCCFCG